MALALSACVTLAPAKEKPGATNPVTGGEIEVTSLAPPKAKGGKTPKKPAPEAPAKGGKTVAALPDGDKLAPPTDAPTVVDPKTRPKARPKVLPETAQTDAAVESPEAADTPPKPELAEPEPAEAQPEAAKTPGQLACEKKGNIWARVGDTGANYCAKRTRDNGKQCSRESDCESVCLARSGTCAPFDPLLGCNEVLQDDGRRVTQCIN